MFYFKLLLPALLLLVGATTTCLSQEEDDSVVEQTCSAGGTCKTVNADVEEESFKQEKPKLSCEDQHESCSDWANVGECTANPRYMNSYCRRSCELCADQVRSNPMLKLLELAQGSDLGVVQKMEDGVNQIEPEAFKKRLESAREYMQKAEVSNEIKGVCRNAHEYCTIWAEIGECDANPRFMKKKCAPVCQSCEYLTVEGRCPLDPDAPEAWKAGDLDKMFLKLTSEPYFSNYSVKVLSDDPWVITMDNVVSEEEAKHLISLGFEEGFKRSADVGKIRPDGSFDNSINEGRTSTNAWCQHSCYEDETARKVIFRLSNITGIDEHNSEYLQLLRYERSQFYNIHHDYIGQHINRQEGVRIMTVYLYLNDQGLEGGGTNFDQLNITVMPKLGRALVWPSVRNIEPNKKDWRTTHQALPVESGIKFGANAWFHMRDFKTPNRNGCTL